MLQIIGKPFEFVAVRMQVICCCEVFRCQYTHTSYSDVDVRDGFSVDRQLRPFALIQKSTVYQYISTPDSDTSWSCAMLVFEQKISF